MTATEEHLERVIGDTWRIDFQAVKTNGEPINLAEPGTKMWFGADLAGRPVTRRDNMAAGGVSGDAQGYGAVIVRPEDYTLTDTCMLGWWLTVEQASGAVTTQGYGSIWALKVRPVPLT